MTFAVFCHRFIWAECGAKCGYGLCFGKAFLFSRTWCSQYHPVDAPYRMGWLNKHSLIFEHPISSESFWCKETGADYFERSIRLRKKIPGWKRFRAFRLQRSSRGSFKKILAWSSRICHVHHNLAENSGICIPRFWRTLPSKDDVAIMKRVESFRGKHTSAPRCC